MKGKNKHPWLKTHHRFKFLKRGRQFQNPEIHLGGVLAILDRFLRNFHQRCVSACRESLLGKIWEKQPKKCQFRPKTARNCQKVAIPQFWRQRAKIHAGSTFFFCTKTTNLLQLSQFDKNSQPKVWFLYKNFNLLQYPLFSLDCIRISLSNIF